MRMAPGEEVSDREESPMRLHGLPRTWITIMVLGVTAASAYALTTTGLYTEAKAALGSAIGGLSQGWEGDLPLITVVLLLAFLAIAKEKFLIVPLISAWIMLAPAILSFSKIDWSQAIFPDGIAQFLTTTLPAWAIVLLGFALALVSLAFRSYVQISRVRSILLARNAQATQVERAVRSMFVMMGLLSLLAAGVAAVVGSLAFLVSPEIASLGLDSLMLALGLILVTLGTYGALLLFERYGGGGSKRPRERRY
ncbi:MAG: hypothetical protein LUQ16_05110 [Methanomassiliicoccales archaeon]|nr:hypothetical protein [Methanomassiliicoccales archaeon]